ncbi:MAG: hypothetical protein JEY94_04500 [Melioribacteraceae bacterium]|nr:hypothetical protein [Melioribacteraceae bacterium]
MSKFERVKDVIEFAKCFHEKVSKLYERLSISTDDERIRIFLDYLSRHEKNIEDQLNEFEGGLSDKLLDSWFRFLPEEGKYKCFEDIKFKPGMDVDDVTDLALEMDKCLLNVYARIASSTENHKIKEIFQSLYDMGNKDIHKLMLSAQTLKTL